MRRNERIRALALGSLGMIAIAVLATRPFTDSWARAAAYSIPIFAAMAAFGFWDRRRTAREMEKHSDRITVRGPVLIVQKPAYNGGTSSVHPETMRELWYHYSIFGWSGANNWGLVYEVDDQRRTIEIYEGDDEFVVEPLRTWCVRRLPGFEPATFDRLLGSIGGDDKSSVLIWAQQDP
jgi:hypothetical protein